MARHNELGKWGEQIACEKLIAEGYGIRETNWHSGHLELDIIATKDKRIVFVEVKTRSTDDVDPLTAIDRKRINHLIRAGSTYIAANNLDHEYQFDIILIVGTPENRDNVKIEHIADAFLPSPRTFR